MTTIILATSQGITAHGLGWALGIFVGCTALGGIFR